MLERYKTAIFGVVIIAIAIGIVTLLTYRTPPVVITINPPGPTSTPQPIRVYITGAVAKPLTTYQLEAGSRVQDAIAAAGGAKPDADLVRINLAQVLHDGDQINVPSVQVASNTVGAPVAIISNTPTPQPGVSTAKPESTKTKASETTKTPDVTSPIHINTATVDELEALPGVGPVLAQAIIDYRTKNGPFKRLSDLDKVSGVGPSKIKAWDGLIVFD